MFGGGRFLNVISQGGDDADNKQGGKGGGKSKTQNYEDWDDLALIDDGSGFGMEEEGGQPRRPGDQPAAKDEADEPGLEGAMRALNKSIKQQNDMIAKRMKAMKKSQGGKDKKEGDKAKSKRDDKVVVYLRVVFLKLGEIDTMKEMFVADAFIQARWREPKLDGQLSIVVVYVRVVFLKMGEIDTLQETFSADAYIQVRWREPKLDGKTSIKVDDIDWDGYWNPKIYIENNLGEPKETIWQTVQFGENDEATVYERRRVKGCFLENLELDDFPFDTQDLTLTVTSERNENELVLEEDKLEISSINVQSFVDEQVLITS